ncbi:MAG TPA: NADH-quinone oxidoreductase subunit J [Dehalococcoidia bacterium]|nr:NADH-quinone oxidoreductase subunit J [Dehalococcoidia bacterium]
MTYEEVIFYVVAAVAVAGALGVVTARNVVHSAVFLILALMAVAAVYVLLASEFLAIVQVLVYGGAVTILILFAMMLTRVRDQAGPVDGPQRPFAAFAAAAFMTTAIIVALETDWRGNSTEEATVVDINAIGNALFTTWAIPFEIASLVLIVALIGSTVLARGEEGEG